MASEQILVVDDYADNLKLLRLVLSVAGYDVKTATDASEALEALQHIKPNLILMDIQLPGMDGLELTKRIKSTNGAACIVALTAYAMKGDEQRFRDAGCDGYLAKPINTRTFAASVREIMDERNRGVLERDERNRVAAELVPR